MKNKFISLLIVAISVFSCASLAPEVSEDGSKVQLASKSQLDGFVFWTDAHMTANRGKSGKMICQALEGVSNPKVIFGGDVVTNYGDIDSCWQKQMVMEDLIRSSARYYRARGNHDLTGRTYVDKRLYTFSQELTSKMLRESMTSEGVFRNPEDPNSCYYYFDEPSVKLRYLVFDTTDSIKGEDEFGLNTGIGKVQRAWMFGEAILKAPDGYSFVVVSHIGPMKSLSPYLEAFAAHKEYSSDSEEYDFSTRKDLTLLFSISGHSHYDFQRFSGGVLYIVHNSDAAYSDYAMDPLYVGEVVSRKNNDIEQSFSYVWIDKQKSIVSMIRFGCGVDARYYLKPVVVKSGSEIALKSSSKTVARWDIYDSDASKYAKYSALGIPSPNGLKGVVTLVRNIASISDGGVVKGLQCGESVAVAISEDGSREFFCVSVE